MEGARAYGSSHALHNHQNSIGRTLFMVKLYGFNIRLQLLPFPLYKYPSILYYRPDRVCMRLAVSACLGCSPFSQINPFGH